MSRWASAMGQEYPPLSLKDPDSLRGLGEVGVDGQYSDVATVLAGAAYLRLKNDSREPRVLCDKGRRSQGTSRRVKIGYRRIQAYPSPFLSLRGTGPLPTLQTVCPGHRSIRPLHIVKHPGKRRPYDKIINVFRAIVSVLAREFIHNHAILDKSRHAMLDSLRVPA